jgi:hypothetical protein
MLHKCSTLQSRIGRKVEHYGSNWAAGLRGTSGRPCCWRAGSAALPPKNVATFSTSSSASVPSLFIALYRLPLLNLLYVSAELWVILKTCVTMNHFTVFLVISTTPSFPKLIWPQNIYEFAIFRRNRLNAKVVWKVTLHNKVNGAYIHTEKLQRSSTLTNFLVYRHPVCAVLSWAVKSILSFPFPSNALFEHLVSWSLCVVRTAHTVEQGASCIQVMTTLFMDTSGQTFAVIATVPRNPCTPRTGHGLGNAALRHEEGEVEVKGTLIISYCVRWMARFVDTWIGGWLGPHVGEYKNSQPLM